MPPVGSDLKGPQSSVERKAPLLLLKSTDTCCSMNCSSIPRTDVNKGDVHCDLLLIVMGNVKKSLKQV